MRLVIDQYAVEQNNTYSIRHDDDRKKLDYASAAEEVEENEL